MDLTVVDENNNDSVERANTVLKANNILGAHILEEKEEWFYQCADNYDIWNSDFYSPKKGMELAGSHTLICFTICVSQYYYWTNTAICRRLFLVKKEIISLNLLAHIYCSV